MAHLTFVYGTVNSGKSMELLRISHNYESLGKRPSILTPATDTRSEEPKVWSRVGLEKKAVSFTGEDSITTLVHEAVADGNSNIVLVDEAQFLTKEQVEELAFLIYKYDIEVMAFGLKTDSNNNLFEGSQSLLVWADRLEEITTLDYKGHGKASMNMKLVDGKPSFHNPQVEIEAKGETMYVPVSRDTYINAMLLEGANEEGN